MVNAVGIDLGTTHTVVACAEGPSPPAVQRIAQRVGAREIDECPNLPSALYLPLDGESDESDWLVGKWASERAAQVPDRGILSAKSWLSHAGIDRAAAILPWGSQGPKLSPLEASRRILMTARRSMPSLGDDARFVVTIPASFDPLARELTIEAAKSTFGTVSLLDEPIAAFLALHHEDQDDLRARAAREDRPVLVLVCDIGGGTSDFCLLKVDAKGPVERVATGRHLLLGGDNIDLGLAHLVEGKLSVTLEPFELRSMVASCRIAKEQLLLGAPSCVVTAERRTAKLVGNVLRAELTEAEVSAFVLDGFFPAVEYVAEPRGARHALTALGLPYERDPAITRHLAAFLKGHLEPGTPLDAVLFNGGTMTPPRVQARILDVLRQWFGYSTPALRHHSLDAAVAIGATRYAQSERLSLRTVRIRAPRSYYLDVGSGNAMSILARGTVENAPQTLRNSGLKARLGAKVRFDLFAADDARSDAPGTVVRAEDLTRVSRLATSLTGAATADVPIDLTTTLNSSGCVSVTVQHQSHSFALAFDLDQVRDETTLAAHHRIDEAVTCIDDAFGKGRLERDDRAAKDLGRNLESTLGERSTWNSATLRALADALIARGPGRRRSADHERTFWLLAGYCVRPGYGYPDDAARVNALSKLVSERLQYPSEARGWQQLLTAMRRMSAGAASDTQAEWFEWLAPFVAPSSAGLKKPKKGHPISSETELLGLFASLERIPFEARIAFADWLLERAYTDRDVRIWQALTRLGLRNLIYTDASYVLPASEVSKWITQLLREPWDDTRARAAALLAQVTHDRVRDVGEALRSRVRAKLEDAYPHMVHILDAHSATTPEAWGGDTLPVGLILDL